MNAATLRNELTSRISRLPDEQIMWVNRYIDSFSNPVDAFGAYSPDERQKLQNLRIALLKGEQSGMDRSFDRKAFLENLHSKYVEN